MHRVLTLVLVTAACAISVSAQHVDSELVRRAVTDYIEGFYEGDSTKLVRSVAPHVQKSGYARRGDATTYRRSSMPYDDFMRFARGVRAGRNLPPPDAPQEVILFDVQDQTASVKVVAWWGTDYLLLARENGRWMITHVLWQSPPLEHEPGEAGARRGEDG